MESKTLPYIEDKALEFTIDIQDAQFNHEGWYYLVITLHSSFTNDYRQVKLRKGDKGPWLAQREVRTNFTKQEENAPLSFFKDKRFMFRMPKGFCKNDKNHDVHLVVEAYVAASTSAGKGRKVGEGKFAIYPRPNAPRMNLYAEPGEDYYHFTGVMSLLRTHSTDNIQMHCGRIRNTYSLKEIPPPTPPTPPRTPPQKLQPKVEQVRQPSPIPLPTPRTDRSDHYPKSQPSPRPQPEPTPQLPHSSRMMDGGSGRPGGAGTPVSSWGENLSLDLNLPKTPPLPPAADGKKIPEPPLNEKNKETFSTGRSYTHVASNGRELIDLIIHGASSLPLTQDGRVPQPYTVIKLKTDEDKNKATGSASHCSINPSHAPSWEERLVLNIDENYSEDDQLVVSVADGPSQKCLCNYRIPIAYLTPFHQYHLELNMPARGIPHGVKTFVSLIRKKPKLPRDPSSPNYLALEVLLRAVQKPIKNPLGPLIAVARIVPDYYNYKSDNLLSHPRNAGVTMHNVTFPSAHPTNFVVTQKNRQGHPQLSLPGRPDVQPEWNHPYLFVEERDKATLFTPAAALVIEYYVASMERFKKTMSDQFWRMQAPVAFSAILMDHEIYKHLTQDRAKAGLRIDGIPVQSLKKALGKGSTMVTNEGKRPTVGAILRLITTEIPESMVSVSNLDNLPALDMYQPAEGYNYYRSESPEILRVQSRGSQPPRSTRNPNLQESPLPPPVTPKTPPSFKMELTEKKDNQGRYVLQRIKKRPLTMDGPQPENTEEPIKDGEMPGFNAVETVLPEYQYIFQPDGDGKKTPSRRGPPPTRPASVKHYEEDGVEKNSMELLDYQSKELTNYRSAVHKMGADILALRNNIKDLESINGTLRRDLANYNDASRLMVDSAELDGLTKPEILSRYAAIKQTLATQTTDLKVYKAKLQQVQNELIKKNDEEKDFLKLQKAHTAQQALIHKLQEKLKRIQRLEQACKSQEEVIQKMERVLEKHHRERGKNKDRGGQSHEANEALLQENKRLREQIDDLRAQLRVGVNVHPDDDKEKMELYQALERAEGRIAALEKQLAENARLWGKERADLSLRLNEAEHGFGRTNAMVLHDFPVYNDSTLGGKSSLLNKRSSPFTIR